MAGGKETPRQKMIGMMYLVLTALLALNVSKQVLDAFCAIEENMQKAAMTHLDRGNQAIDDLKAETTDKTNPEKVKKVKMFLKQINKIDDKTAALIKQIDDLKETLLTKSGEKITDGKESDAKARDFLRWKKYDAADPLRPTRFNLLAVSAKDQYDVPMEVMIGAGAEPNAPSASSDGMKLWKAFNQYRVDLLNLTGSYKDGEKKFTCNVKDINNHKDNADLIKKVTTMFDSQKVNPEDKDELITLYCNLTKQEEVSASAEGDTDTKWHWVGKTWDHSPLVAAIASLTSLQSEILAARAQAIRLIKAKITTGEYSFNKVEAIAAGPDIVTQGDEVNLLVMMAAFDSDKQPEIRNISGGSVSEIKNGQATIKANAGGAGDMRISGEIGVRKKSGDMQWKPWEKTIKVMGPSGSISLPELSILYEGYENIVEAVASGYDDCSVSGKGVSLSPTKAARAKGGKTFIARPAKGTKEATISLTGKNSITNKSAPLGTFTFKVRRLPDPSLLYKIGASKLTVGYPPEFPLNAAKLNYTVTSWKVSIAGAQIAPIKGNGSSLNGAATGLIGRAPGGTTIVIEVRYNGGGRMNAFTSAVVKKP
jgi:hypothetical protein